MSIGFSNFLILYFIVPKLDVKSDLDSSFTNGKIIVNWLKKLLTVWRTGCSGKLASADKKNSCCISTVISILNFCLPREELDIINFYKFIDRINLFQLTRDLIDLNHFLMF